MAIVRMKTLECGPNGNFPEGSLREVSFEQGEMLVATRHAEWVDKGVSAEAEAAAAEAAAAEAAAAEAAAAEAAAAEAEVEKRKQADAAKPKQPARR